METAEAWSDDRGWDRGRIGVGGVELHCVVAGAPGDPPVVLLHGFPEFWYGWRHQLGPLAREFRVVAPDLRGYNLSDRPTGVAAYDLARLRADVIGLVDAVGPGSARLVGHDWGGVIAQSVARHAPGAVDRLVVANAPYPGRLREQFGLRQVLRSWYGLAVQLPAVPERLLAVRGYALLRRAVVAQATVADAFTHADLERYRASWDRPGALAAMLGYYRAFGRRQLRITTTNRGGPRATDRPVAAPTLLLWGERDPALGRGVREVLERRLEPERVERYPNASHWLHLEYPERVTEELLAFL
jgi:pimeloyl-ACP methyl ester carboxylesterase